MPSYEPLTLYIRTLPNRTGAMQNFREFPTCELRGILLLRTRVNKGKEEGPRRYTPALTGDGEASLLPRRRTEDLRSIPGADGSQPLHLGFVGRLLWLGRHCK
jgi:hypothetical protein